MVVAREEGLTIQFLRSMSSHPLNDPIQIQSIRF
jgi:hypothetical protein